MSSARESKKMAMCGVMSALAVVLMFINSLIYIGTFTGPVLAMAALIPVLSEYGAKPTLISYVCIALICLVIMPDKEMALFFACLGWYPSVIGKLSEIKPAALSVIVKLAIFMADMALMYGVLMKVLGIETESFEGEKYLMYILLVVGAFAFIMFDIAYRRYMLIWQYKLRKKFGMK